MSKDIDRDEYPFESKWLPLREGRMHYVDQGSGEPIVFVHGTPTWSFEWRHLLRAFAGSHRVIAPDHLGFGLSERPVQAPYSPEWHSRNFAEFVQRLNPAPFTLVVHDYGGPIALPLAIERPDLVKRIVVINSWMWSFAGDREMERKARIAGSVLGRVLYKWANLSLRVIMPAAYGDRRKLTAEIHQQYLDRFVERSARRTVLWPLAHALLGSHRFYDSLWQRRAELATREALIIWGMKDSAFPPDFLARWQDALPRARVIRIASAGHWPHEEEPAAVMGAMRDFVAMTHVSPPPTDARG